MLVHWFHKQLQCKNRKGEGRTDPWITGQIPNEYSCWSPFSLSWGGEKLCVKVAQEADWERRLWVKQMLWDDCGYRPNVINADIDKDRTLGLGRRPRKVGRVVEVLRRKVGLMYPNKNLLNLRFHLFILVKNINLWKSFKTIMLYQYSHWSPFWLLWEPLVFFYC